MIVAFSTSSPLASVAVFGDDGSLLGSASEEARMNASGVCLRLLSGLLCDVSAPPSFEGGAGGACSSSTDSRDGVNLPSRPSREGILSTVRAFVSDLGPGSFTGVKVGVTLAKTMALASGGLAGGVPAFDLVSPTGLVVIPSKKGEFFWRMPSGEVVVRNSLPDEPFVGFGPGVDHPVLPLASRFAPLLAGVELRAPENLVPMYVLEPAISVPNKPFRSANA